MNIHESDCVRDLTRCGGAEDEVVTKRPWPAKVIHCHVISWLKVSWEVNRSTGEVEWEAWVGVVGDGITKGGRDVGGCEETKPVGWVDR